MSQGRELAGEVERRKGKGSENEWAIDFNKCGDLHTYNRGLATCIDTYGQRNPSGTTLWSGLCRKAKLSTTTSLTSPIESVVCSAFTRPDNIKQHPPAASPNSIPPINTPTLIVFTGTVVR